MKKQWDKQNIRFYFNVNGFGLQPNNALFNTYAKHMGCVYSILYSQAPA